SRFSDHECVKLSGIPWPPSEKRQRTDRTPRRFATKWSARMSARFWSAVSPLPLFIRVLAMSDRAPHRLWTLDFTLQTLGFSHVFGRSQTRILFNRPAPG